MAGTEADAITSSLELKCHCPVCINRRADKPGPALQCAIEERVKVHLREVAQLIISSPTIRILVGPEEAEFVCHKHLLSFYSTFFDNSMYGPFKESYGHEIKLPEEDFDRLSMFFRWLYTGRVSRQFNTRCFQMRWWLQGDKFGAPSFSNDAIHTICDTNVDGVSSKFAEGVYRNTCSGARLRKFAADSIKAHGPFQCQPALTCEARKAWIELLAKGGDLVRDVGEYGLHNFEPANLPSEWPNRAKYMELEPIRSAVEWCLEKRRLDKLREPHPGSNPIVQETPQVSSRITNLLIAQSFGATGSKRSASAPPGLCSKRQRTQ